MDVERQHDALDPICTRVFEETASRRLLVKNRPELLATLNYLGSDDVLVVMKVNHLFEEGVIDKVLRALLLAITSNDHPSWTCVGTSRRSAAGSSAEGSRPV